MLERGRRFLIFPLLLLAFALGFAVSQLMQLRASLGLPVRCFAREAREVTLLAGRQVDAHYMEARAGLLELSKLNLIIDIERRSAAAQGRGHEYKNSLMDRIVTTHLVSDIEWHLLKIGSKRPRTPKDLFTSKKSFAIMQDFVESYKSRIAADEILERAYAYAQGILELPDGFRSTMVPERRAPMPSNDAIDWKRTADLLGEIDMQQSTLLDALTSKTDFLGSLETYRETLIDLLTRTSEDWEPADLGLTAVVFSRHVAIISKLVTYLSSPPTHDLTRAEVRSVVLFLEPLSEQAGALHRLCTDGPRPPQPSDEGARFNSDSPLSGGFENVRRSPARSNPQGAHLKPNGRRFTASERMAHSSSSPSRMLERTPIVGCSFEILIGGK